MQLNVKAEQLNNLRITIRWSVDLNISCFASMLSAAAQIHRYAEPIAPMRLSISIRDWASKNGYVWKGY